MLDFVEGGCEGAKCPCGEVEVFDGGFDFTFDEDAHEVGEEEDDAEVGDVGVGEVLEELYGCGDLNEGVGECSEEADNGVPFGSAESGGDGFPAGGDEVDVE